MDLLRQFDRLFTRVLTYCGRQAKVITFTIGWIRYLVWRTQQYVGVLFCLTLSEINGRMNTNHQYLINYGLRILSQKFLTYSQGWELELLISRFWHKNIQSAYNFSHFSNIFKIIHIYIYCSNSPVTQFFLYLSLFVETVIL